MSTKSPMSKNYGLALGAASEIAMPPNNSDARLYELRQTIHGLVGRWVQRGSRWAMVWPAAVCDEARLDADSPYRLRATDEVLP